MIFTERTIKIANNVCTINSPVVLYRGDYNIEVRFTILDCPYQYSNKNSANVIESTEASYGQLVIRTPGDAAPIFSTITATKEGSITFTIEADMIDENTEVGNYTFQIRLLDENQESRATIPEVIDGIEIREPIASEDVSDTNEVDVATVGYALTTAAANEDAFDAEGNYNKTTWGTGDRITASKLNKIEAGIDGVNQKVASGSTGGQGMTEEQVQQLSTAYQHSQTAHVQPSDIPTKTSQLTNDSGYITNIPDEYITETELNAKGYATTSQIPTVPTNVSEFTNDANYASETYVTNKIAEASLSGGGTVNNINDTTASATTTYSSNKIERIIGSETLNTSAQDIKGAINEVFQNASNGKALIANAITGMGIEASETDTFEQLANKISLIIPVTYGNIIVDTTNIEITEGGTGTFTVHLDQAPTNNQIINIASNNSKVTVSPNTLTFTKDNYNTVQTVTVSAQDDSIEENGYTLELILSSENVDNVVINITVKDNDTSYNPVVAPLSDYTYTKIGNNVYLQTYNGSAEDILVPATYELEGTNCGVYLFSKDKNIFPTGVRYVKFEDGVEDYQNSNFKSCFKDNTTLRNVENIPESAHNWGYAFYGCTALKSTIPFNDGATNIQRAYYGCTSLINASNFEIPSGCNDASETFSGCTALEDGGTIPSHISSLTRTYFNCTSLKKLTIKSKTLTGLDVNSGFLAKVTSHVTIHGYLDSAIFTELKSIVCTQNGRKNIFFESLTTDKQINISCFGDSLTAGQNVTPNYPTALNSLVPSNTLVYCYGNGGYTLEQIAGVMDSYPERLIDDVVIIWGGINNSTATTSVDTYKEYVKTMIAKLSTTKYVIMTPVYAKYNSEYDTAFASEFGEHFFSLRDWFDNNSYTIADYVTDGTHFNAEGNNLIAQAVNEKLSSLGYI